MSENQKLRVFGVPWHLGHQYELAKLPFLEWSWLIQYKRQYGIKPRGDFMKNWVPYYEPGKYDLAVLHLDQQCIEDTILERGKGRVYMELNKVIQDIPKIVIMHGTPYYPEKFADPQEIVKKVKQIVGDNFMITNSKTTAKQFGWGHPIIHGLDPDEWWDLPKEPRVVSMISPGGLDSYYDRSFLEAVRDLLEEQGISHCHITVDFMAKDWDDYRNFLGRSLIYFNPTRESPMPRSRTEAMLSGCLVLTTNNQDADEYFEDGVNGIFVKRNPEDVVEKILYYMKNYDEAVAIGKKARETAIEKLHISRYQKDWADAIEIAMNQWKEKRNIANLPSLDRLKELMSTAKKYI